MSVRGICAAASLVVLQGCSGGAQDGPGAASAGAPAGSDASRPPSAAPSLAAAVPPPPSATAPALAPIDAPAAEREAAALAILRGDVDVAALPVDATEKGLPLDPTLRDRLSPRATPPRVKMGKVTVTGRLPPEVVQRIVRQRFGRFRICYEQALARDPSIEGRVEVAFTIANDGSAVGVAERSSTVTDAVMRTCVVETFQSLSFPQPEGGVVQVVCPVQFEPPVE